MSESEADQIRRRLAEIDQELYSPQVAQQVAEGMTPEQREALEADTVSPIVQSKLMRAVEIEFLQDIVNELAKSDAYDAILTDPNFEWFNYLAFDPEPDDLFEDRNGNSGFLVCAPCNTNELIGTEEATVPAWLPTKASVFALEVVEKAIGSNGMRIAVAGGGSEYHVRQMKQGNTNPMPLVTNRQIQQADTLWDKGYVSQRLLDKVIESERKIFALEEQLVDSRQASFVIGEKYYEARQLLGKGGRKGALSLKWIALIAIIGIAVVVLMYVLTKGGI